jgi:biopolymer transport protein ExbB/TolQ
LAPPIEYANLARLVKVLNVSQPNRAAALFQQMITVFNKTRSAEILQSDIGNFMQGEKDTLDGFNRMVTFLSSTARTLGWSGTLWGIFVVLYAGNMEGRGILRGISGALFPVLAGLIISWVFYLDMILVHFLSHRQLKLMGERAEELRQALLQLQIRPTQRHEKVPRTATPARMRPIPAPEPVVVSEEEVEGWR